MVSGTDVQDAAPKQIPFAAVGRVAYRVVGAFLVFLVAAVGGGAIGLALAGGDAEGLEGLGAAILGMFYGGIVGVVGAIGFLFIRLPSRLITRWIVIAVLTAVFFAAIGIQEIYA